MSELSDPADNVEKRQKLYASRCEGSSEAASQKLVQDFMAFPKSSEAKEEAGEEEKLSSLERKRKINRLSAQRKRVSERVQLDTLTDRYAQLSYRNEALKGDNDRLTKLISSLKGTLSEAKQEESSASVSQQKPSDRGAYLLEKLGMVEKIRQTFLAGVLEGHPATGSAAGSTTENPFVQTTNHPVAKVRGVDHTRQTLISVLHSVQQAQAPAPASVGVHVGNMFSAAAANQAAPQQWPVAQEISVSLHSQLLSALRAPAPPPPAPTASAAPNAMVLLQLLAVLSGSAGNAAQPNQAAVSNSVQIPNMNVASNYQGFQGVPAYNISQPASASGTISVCSQPTKFSLPSVTSQTPVGGSMNNAQVASLAAILQLLENR